MSPEERWLLIDYDSIAYKAGSQGTLQAMRTYTDNKMLQIAHQCGSNKLYGWVERTKDKSCFRKHVATTKKYKGNRTTPKPHLLDEAKEYAVERYPIRWAQPHLESEDHVLIAAKQLGFDATVKVAIDKDLNQQQGDFYNYDKNIHFTVSEAEAVYNLYHQFLTGDSTDNIPGLPGCGTKGATQALSCAPEEYAEVVAKEYIKKGHPRSYLVEQARLIYLLREFDEVYEYPVDREQWKTLEETKENE